MEESREKIVYIVIVVANGLSIISCLFIISIYILAKDLRVYAFKLVIILCIIDTLKSSSMILPTYNLKSDDFLCKVQAIFLQFFTLASFMMTFITGLTLYMCITVKNRDKLDLNYIYGIIVLGFPLIATVIPWFYDEFEKDTVWCWIAKRPIYWRIVTFYGPLWVLNLINLWVYFKVISKLKAEEHINLRRLRVFPLILIICYLPATIERSLEIFGYDDDFTLILTMCLGDGLLGLINAISYGLTDNVKSFIYKDLCKKRKLSYQELLKYEYNTPE
ncbi:hypothetical protein SteCoe_3663 [Stentor coeruleus]|uniref:G-protein coupled receptors family 2 profile 2 domain-containing protein n=1 Tax=Stentor coeruleus TaxID=5963 RepID=A0A1R2CWP8_9CILI|nr:hypothetical protein SteCoe_3663 [Stentor coeruleus]